MRTILHKPVCDLLNCTYPVLLSGKGAVVHAELVAAVTEAGGFGFLGFDGQPAELNWPEITALQTRGIRHFGVDLDATAAGPALLENQISVCITRFLPVVGLLQGAPPDVISRLRAAGILAVCQIGSVAEAKMAEQAGAQILIAWDMETEGRPHDEWLHFDLLQKIIKCTHLPVLAAGGLRDGTDLATALALGAQGAVFKAASAVTPEQFRGIIAEAINLHSVSAASPNEPARFASPACLAHEMAGNYMGFLSREELLVALNELLEAERTALRAVLYGRSENQSDKKSLSHSICHDLVCWSNVLILTIQRLGGIVSGGEKLFYEDSIPSKDFLHCQIFVKHKLMWTKFKLNILLSTIQDDAVHTVLKAMLISHDRLLNEIDHAENI